MNEDGLPVTVNVEKGYLNSDSLSEVESEHDLKRGLKARHLTMIAIGGTIGTGLFLGSGSSIAQAGPGGSLVAYLIIGIMIYFMMSSLGEMATYMPISGSFNTYAKRFFDPALGFAMGWNYWYSWAITVAVEISAGAIVMGYWLPNVPSWVWSLTFLVIMLSFNLFSVRGYGEAEYWFAIFKVLAVVLFIIIGILLDIGAVGKPKRYIGTENFNRETFHNGFKGLLSVFFVTGFSFQGTELVGIAAGESANPEKNVPKAIKQVFWRILLFYVLAIFVIGLLVPYDNPDLLSNSDVAVSPFTLAFQMIGFVGAPYFMNAIILTTVLSAGNSSLYASSRVLYNLAMEGQAPKFFKRVSKNGIPLPALLLTTIVGCVGFLMSLFGEGKVYLWLLNLSGVSGFVQWAGISFTHWRFRRAYVAQGRPLNELLYKANLYPFGPIFSFTVVCLVIAGQGYNAFTASGGVDPQAVVEAYIGVPVFFLLYFGYKLVNKTKIIPLVECDLETDKRIFVGGNVDHRDEKGVKKAWSKVADVFA